MFKTIYFVFKKVFKDKITIYNKNKQRLKKKVNKNTPKKVLKIKRKVTNRETKNRQMENREMNLKL